MKPKNRHYLFEKSESKRGQITRVWRNIYRHIYLYITYAYIIEIISITYMYTYIFRGTVEDEKKTHQKLSEIYKGKQNQWHIIEQMKKYHGEIMS